MNKIKKHFLILLFLLSIMILFSNTSIVKADNEDQELIVNYNEKVDAKKLEEMHSTKFKVLITPRIKLEANATQEDVNKYYYNQLTQDISRNTYNLLTDQISNNIEIDLNNSVHELENVTEENIIECFKINYFPYILDGYEAYIMDGAKNYWWTPEGLEFGTIKTSYEGNAVTFKTVELKSTAEEWNDHETFEEKFEEVCNSITGKSTYEIAKSINYYIYNNVEYKILDDTSMEQSAYGALVLKQAVCEGQAQLFKLMCKEKGIMCLNVFGYIGDNNEKTAHAWNYVYEPTKKQWYAVDVTWNTSYKKNLYFMVGSNTEINGVKFEKNHIAGFKQFEDQTYQPATPKLATEKYIEEIKITEEKYITNIQPNTELKELLKEIKSIVNDTSITVNDDNRVLEDTDIIKTGQKVTIGEEPNSSTYITVVLGDVNGDGAANIRDILRINRHRLNRITLENECFIAANVNKDDKVNINDILKINRYRLERLNEF